MARSHVHKLQGKLRREVLECGDLDHKTMGQTAGWPSGMKREMKQARKKKLRREGAREVGRREEE